MTKKPKSPASSRLSVPTELIERRIYLIRGRKVMLDSDLAALYEVTTFNLNKAVKRNLDRFPEDFMFRLTPPEDESLIFQIGMSKASGRGGRRNPPFAFTEHGIAMLSSVLKSKRAVQMNILIIRAFIKLRDLLATHKEVAARLEKLEMAQKQHASVISILVEEIDRLKAPAPQRRIGFKTSEAKIPGVDGRVAESPKIRPRLEEPAG
jgi:hypothetical protein